MKQRIALTALTAAVLLASVLEAAAEPQTVSFIARRNFPAGAAPQSAATGDFDGDQVLDLAVANYSSNDVSILLGNGDGTFQLPVNVGAGAYPISVADDDFNADGALDLAVANDQSNDITLLLGNGDGTFRAPLTFPAGTRPLSVNVGHLNRDELPDLAVANRDGVSLLLGNGDGTFQTARTFGAGSFPSAVAVLDFNDDGIADLAVTNYFSYDVSVLLGTGTGSFLPALNVHSGPRPWSIIASDFNGDGKPDLAIANLGDSVTLPLNGDLAVLLGIGDGTFQPAQHFGPGIHPFSVVAGDVNGDDEIDLAVPSGVLFGNGDGTFQAPRYFALSGSDSSFVAIGDYSTDGHLDLVVAGNDSVSVLMGNGDGTFLEAPLFAAGSYPSSVAAGDFNGDGFADLAVANANSGVNATVSVLLGNGDGSFHAPQAFLVGGFPISVVVADFNGDRGLDLAVANWSSSDVSVLLGNGDGTFQTAQNISVGAYPESAAAGDFSGDGKPDLAVANEGSHNISILISNGDGTFRADPPLAVGPHPHSVAVGDFNGDGKLDLAATNRDFDDISGASSGVWTILGNGDGGFEAAQRIAVGGAPYSLALGDLDRDSKLDIALTTIGYGVFVLLGNGDGTVREPTGTSVAGSFLWHIAVGDFSGDHVPDLAVANSDGNSVPVLVGNGDGTVQAVTFRAANSPQSIAVGDFNRDGKPDLAVANEYSAGVSVLINNTVQRPQVAAVTFSPAGDTYTQPQAVSLNTATRGAAIHFTTDGSTPTSSSPVYSGAISVRQTTTIQAIAVATGMADSAVASATYTLQAATPTFNPPGGPYRVPRFVRIGDASPGVTIHYTTDGTTPTTSSSVYTGAILVVRTATIKAMAVAPGWSPSAVASATYRMLLP